MLEKKNFAKSTIATVGGINDTDLTFNISAGDGSIFPDTGATKLFRLVIWSAVYVSPEEDANREIIECYRSAGDTFVISDIAYRGMEGTSVKAWDYGANVAMTITAGVLEELENSGGLNNIVEDLTPQLGGDLDINNNGIGDGGAPSAGYVVELPNSSSKKCKAYAWITYSDGRIKTNQEELNYGLDELLKLLPKRYNMYVDLTLNGKKSPEIGLIAQEVQKVIPEAVIKPDNEKNDLWALNEIKLIPVLINAIKDLNEKIDDLEGRLIG